ncbi:MAG: hypothetical protein COB66_04580 [Coxiella sp. (in: Bacteria)]|nr:MAG: hypothetical protein COB66_04580 [Coxiella sp. (in: g-proteobacteria)]
MRTPATNEDLAISILNTFASGLLTLGAATFVYNGWNEEQGSGGTPLGIADFIAPILISLASSILTVTSAHQVHRDRQAGDRQGPTKGDSVANLIATLLINAGTAVFAYNGIAEDLVDGSIENAELAGSAVGFVVGSALFSLANAVHLCKDDPGKIPAALFEVGSLIFTIGSAFFLKKGIEVATAPGAQFTPVEQAVAIGGPTAFLAGSLLFVGTSARELRRADHPQGGYDALSASADDSESRGVEQARTEELSSVVSGDPANGTRTPPELK